MSGIKQMINSQLDAAAPAAPTSKQPRHNQTFIRYVFGSNAPPRFHPVNWWDLRHYGESPGGLNQRRLLTVWPCQVRSGGSAASWQGPCSPRSSACPGRRPADTRGDGGWVVGGVTGGFNDTTVQKSN